MSLSDKSFDRLNKLFVILITLIIIYPLIFVVSASISNPAAVASGKVWLWPVDITLRGYQMVFKNHDIWIGYRNTIVYTLVGAILHLLFLMPSAYALSRKEVIGKKSFMMFIVFTMLFSGGLIPTYLVVKSLGMLDTIWAIVIPNVIGAWSILVARAFFQQSIPEQLVEASKIDGASDFYIFRKVVIPLSLPIVAVMALFHAVGLWNQYFNALIYLSDENLYPLQLVLRQMLVFNELGTDITSGAGAAGTYAEKVATAAIVKYAVIIISSLPLLIIYPFLQRFFVKGVLIGSVKE